MDLINIYGNDFYVSDINVFKRFNSFIPTWTEEVLSFDKNQDLHSIRFQYNNYNLLFSEIIVFENLKYFIESEHLDLIKEYVEEKKLEFRRVDIYELPHCLNNLKDLDRLDIVECRLWKIPDQIFSLTNLKQLHLNDNGIEVINEKIGELANLEVLDISNNDVKSLPSTMSNLINLKEFYFFYNPIDNLNSIKFPDRVLTKYDDVKLFLSDYLFLYEFFNFEVKNLTNYNLFNKNKFLGFDTDNNAIVWLEINSCYIRSIPESIRNLKNIKQLIITNNSLDEFIITDNLFNLEFLDLSFNNLSKLPDNLFELKNLKHLDISGNDIELLPDFLNNMNLESFYFWGCKLKNLHILTKFYNKSTKINYLDVYQTDYHGVKRIWNDKLIISQVIPLYDLFHQDNFSIFGRFHEYYPDAIELTTQDKFLTGITLQRFHFSNILDSFKNLSFLRQLNLEGCSFNKVTDLDQKIPTIESLSFAFSHFELLPTGFDKLPHLTILDLSNVYLRNKPHVIEIIPSLKVLKIGNLFTWNYNPDAVTKKMEQFRAGDYGKFDVLPIEICNFENLEVLELSDSYILHFPDALFNMKRLKRIIYNPYFTINMSSDFTSESDIIIRNHNFYSSQPKDILYQDMICLIEIIIAIFNQLEDPRGSELILNETHLTIEEKHLVGIKLTSMCFNPRLKGIQKLKSLKILDLSICGMYDLPIDFINNLQLEELIICHVNLSNFDLQSIQKLFTSLKRIFFRPFFILEIDPVKDLDDQLVRWNTNPDQLLLWNEAMILTNLIIKFTNRWHWEDYDMQNPVVKFNIEVELNHIVSIEIKSPNRTNLNREDILDSLQELSKLKNIDFSN